MTQIAPESMPPATPTPRGRGCAPWLIGCGVTLALVLAIGGGAAWWFVGRPVMQVFSAIQDVQSVESLDARIRDRSPFTPPADGLLSDAQVQRFLNVQRSMGEAVSGRIAQLEARFEEIDGREFRWTDALQLAGVYTDLFRGLVETKESQVAALNAEGFSAAEYAWVRLEVLRAAGIDAPVDVGAFVGAMTGDEGARPTPRSAAAPQANRDLVERYREALDEYVILAVIGL